MSNGKRWKKKVETQGMNTRQKVDLLEFDQSELQNKFKNKRFSNCSMSKFYKLGHKRRISLQTDMLCSYMLEISAAFLDHCWVFIYVNYMQKCFCTWLFVCIFCNGQSCPSYLTWGDWFSLDLRALPLTHVVRCDRACTSQTTWSLLQWRSGFK